MESVCSTTAGGCAWVGGVEGSTFSPPLTTDVGLLARPGAGEDESRGPVELDLLPTRFDMRESRSLRWSARLGLGATS